MGTEHVVAVIAIAGAVAWLDRLIYSLYKAEVQPELLTLLLIPLTGAAIALAGNAIREVDKKLSADKYGLKV